MPCSRDEALVRLFYNTSSALLLLFLFLSFSSILLVKFFNFIGSYSIFQRDQDEYEYEYVFSDDEVEEQTEQYQQDQQEKRYCDYYQDAYGSTEQGHLVADIIGGGESLVFLHNNKPRERTSHSFSERFVSPRESINEEPQENDLSNNYVSHLHDSKRSETEDEGHEIENEDLQEGITATDTDSFPNNSRPTSPISMDMPKNHDLTQSHDKKYDEDYGHKMTMNKRVESNLRENEKYLVFAATQLESKKFIDVEEKVTDEEIYGDSCTVGSTSKSSSEWRSSINCRDSVTEDPFSSSSRRSCPKWESYTVFQKYDEEMAFLDRVSAQKLTERESLRSINVSPRSISERIVHKFVTINKMPSHVQRNPYHELEAAYVAQICLTWEALNWNYKNFQSKRASRDPGCPDHIAQQFQQFQVLLQRYIENEPYEHGRRPEIYARMRLLAPKLLLVPEYREDDERDNGSRSRISSASFLLIMDEMIRTFMNFLKAEKERPCQIIAAYFRRNRRGSVDPTLLNLMKKVNQKKKIKLKDLRRSRKCLRKRKLKAEEEMEILMGLIDLKVVSRVLRMTDLSEQQLQWCEEKMSKVRVLDGKLHRDSSTLFFPAH